MARRKKIKIRTYGTEAGARRRCAALQAARPERSFWVGVMPGDFRWVVMTDGGPGRVAYCA